MASINTVINNISNQNISLFFENKITSFKPEREVFANTVNADTPYADPIKIGYAELKNHEELLVFTCEYNKELTARSAKKKQFEIAKKVLKEDFKDGAIFIFYDAQGNFRFSFIRRNYGQAGDKKFSTWKRFTYYVTPSETNRTFIERIDKCDYSSLDSIQEAFSVEKLTKQFYNELFAWYQWALSNEIGITYPNNTKTSDDDRVKLEEQVIRLITRLLFVWFIKQKKLVPEYLFDTNELEKSLIDFDGNSKVEGNYYNAILQNLFFATLNKEISEREFAKTKDRDIKTRYRYEEMFALSESEIIEYFKPIPFLNGGLFECLDKQDTDGNQYFLDGFSRNPTKAANGNFKHRAFIPNCLFFDEEKGIIPLLKSYNFTVEENAPNEVQVALDPELLGKVFENLLGAFNPETKETARKQSGSFYTPREIVEYMVNESLINYLQTKLPNLDEKDLRDLFENETPNSAFLNDSKQCNEIAHALKAIKILDPACGSGAFPMGILSKMVEVLEKLGATDESIHDLKLHLIEECIYGIDIQTIATQISKLRFFITLVVEQDKIDLSKPHDNYGVLTLPNLETKFVSANTLIGIKKKKAGDFVSTLFTDSAIDDTKQQLLNIRHEHFYAKTAGAKKRLREQDALLRDKLAKLLEENKDFAPDDALQLSQWNPYDQNTSSPFFDMEWMFGVKKGFDVVIGNPPYVFTRDVDFGADFKDYVNKEYFKDIALPSKSKSRQAGKINLFAIFLLKGKRLIKKNGNLIYIIPNNILRGTVYDVVRYELLKNNDINSIVDLGEGVFSKVTASTILIQLSNKTSLDFETEILTYVESLQENKYKTKYINQNVFLENTSYTFNIMLNKEQMALSSKIDKNKKSLGECCVDIIAGIAATKDLIFEKPEDGTFELFEGKDIKRFYFGEAKNHIVWKPNLIARTRPDYLWKEDKKIVNQRISGGTMPLVFALDTQKRRTFNSTNNIVLKKSLKTHYEFFTCLLNSRLINWYYANNFSNNSNLTVNISKTFLETLPIQLPTNNVLSRINDLHQELENTYGTNDFNENYELLNIIIYKLYNLTHQEVLLIDPAFSLTQEEYENYQIT